MTQEQVRITRLDPLKFAAAALTVLAAPVLFVLEQAVAGFALLLAGLAVAWWYERRATRRLEAVGAGAAGAGSGAGDAGSASGLRDPSPAQRTPSLLRDLSLVAMGLAIVRTINLEAQLDNWSMLRFTLALGGAVAVPYLVSRFLYRDRAIGFPWRHDHDGRPNPRWGRLHWTWLLAVLLLGWLILPWYFISSGVYLNWPVVDTPDLIARLFVGVGAVGIWDELFFICTVFTVLLRHFPVWAANMLQATVFVSFLWELGYRAWGPLLTIPFALVQGFIFLRTRSLSYVVTVHLLFDAVVFAVLVHAHDPSLFNIFPTAP
ncbi:MAG: CPBP family intramembrane glutamic endopeptidase [Leucobacter sp.]